MLALGLMAGCTARLSTPGRAACPHEAHSQLGTAPVDNVNIVIFLVDTLRADRLGLYGYDDRPTSPRLDRLAEESVVFEHAYAPAPWTLPTVMSLLTSTYPCQHKVLHNRHRLGEAFDTLAEGLRALGYTTVSLYANPFAGPKYGLKPGFDIMKNRFRQQTDGPTVAAVLDEIEALPCFFYVHNTEPHNPYDYAPGHTDGFPDVSESERTWFARKHSEYRRLSSIDFRRRRPVGTTDNTAEQERVLDELDSRRDEYSKLYDAAVHAADEHIGSVVDVLKERGIWDETLFIIVADHGEEFGEHGGWLHDQSAYEELTHVPLIMRFPHGQFAGRRIGTAVSLIDVVPTIADYLEEPTLAEGAQGRSLLPLIRGDPGSEDLDFRVVGVRMNRKKYYRPWKESRGDTNVIVRYGSWKAIWNVELDTLELYDLTNSADEQQDLSATKPELASAMAAFARCWYQQCADQAGEPEDVTDELDEETLQDLRALGYID
jgi:arylsulfatase